MPPTAHSNVVVVRTLAEANKARDLHVWRAILAALEETRAFAVARLGERPADRAQFGAADTPAAILTPTAWAEADPWDDEARVETRRDGQFLLTVVVREADDARRFALLDRLDQVVANAIDGQSLAGLTIPGLTRIRGGSYEPAREPEKHLVLRGEYAYFSPGYDGRDEDDDDLGDPY